MQRAPIAAHAPALTTPEGEDALRLAEAGLVYALDRPPRKDGKRVVLAVRHGPGLEAAEVEEAAASVPLRDQVNLYARRSRWHFARHVAERFGVDAQAVMGHLDLLLDQVERALDHAARPEAAQVVLDAERRAAAERLLAAPDLLGRAAAAIEAAGFVGEDAVKRLVYLVATSRLLPRPLSAVLLAPSCSGKSELLDRVVAMLPAEEVERLSRLTPAALFYAGREHLVHKLLVVDEEVGAAEAAHSIRALHARGRLELRASVRGRVARFETRGPIALLSSAARPGLEPGTLARCLALPLDDGPEQTARVLEAQRRAWADAPRGGELAARGDEALQPWRDAQRLLQPATVVIPFAAALRFPARTARDRRGHDKLGALIAAHALLHDRQRDRDAAGRVLARVEDYAAVHELLAPLVEQQLEDLSPRASALYRHLGARTAGPSVTRREVAAELGWSYSGAVRVLGELLEHELIEPSAGRKPVRYRLLEGSLLVGSAPLLPPEELLARSDLP